MAESGQQRESVLGPFNRSLDAFQTTAVEMISMLEAVATTLLGTIDEITVLGASIASSSVVGPAPTPTAAPDGGRAEMLPIAVASEDPRSQQGPPEISKKEEPKATAPSAPPVAPTVPTTTDGPTSGPSAAEAAKKRKPPTTAPAQKRADVPTPAQAPKAKPTPAAEVAPPRMSFEFPDIDVPAPPPRPQPEANSGGRGRGTGNKGPGKGQASARQTSKPKQRVPTEAMVEDEWGNERTDERAAWETYKKNSNLVFTDHSTV